MSAHPIRLVLGLVAALFVVLPVSGATAKTSTKHHLDMYKVEQHATLDEYDSFTFSLSCPDGDIAADGMWRIDDVDQYNFQLADDDEDPWNIATAIDVIWAYPTGLSSYSFKVRNNTSGEAQVKFFLTCLGKKTAPDTEQHSLVYTSDDHTDYGPFNEQDFFPANTAMECGSNEIFIQPGFKVNAGHATIFASYPSSNLRRWTYGFYVKAPATEITTYGRCLNIRTSYTNGHRHRIYPYYRTAPVFHFNRGNGVWDHKINCGDNQKGLIGGFNLHDGVHHWNDHTWHWLGMDPRIKSRVFKTFGTTSGGDYYLVCVNDRTSRKLS